MSTISSYYDPAQDYVSQAAARQQSLYTSAYNQNEAQYTQAMQGYQNQIAANQAQYNQALGQYNQNYGAAMNNLSAANTSNIYNLGVQGQQSLGTTDQGLVSRGLNNTTVKNAADAGVQQNTNQAITQSNSDFAGQQAQMGAQYAQGLLSSQQAFGQQQAGLYGQAAQTALGNVGQSPNPGTYSSALNRTNNQYGGPTSAPAQPGIGSYGIGSMGAPGSAYGGAAYNPYAAQA